MPGFIHSKYQLQKSSHTRVYNTFNASLSLNWPISKATSADTCASRHSNHAMANVSVPPATSMSDCLASHSFISLRAFHILLLKFRPCSNADSSNKISLPAGDAIITPNLVASAPYCSISARRSGELPRLLLIFLPCLSLTIPVK